MNNIYLNVSEEKKESLLNALSTIDKRKLYNFYLLSCYFNPKSLIDVVSGVREFAKLNKVYIYIDKREAIAAGYDLNKKISDLFKNEHANLDFEVRVVDSDALFHTKAYALIACDDDNHGSLVIGSANLTKSGLTNKTGNIETIIPSSDRSIISGFIKNISSLQFLDLSEINNFTKSSSIAFKLALLCQGYFVHKWSDTIKQQFAVPYSLTDKGRRDIKNKDSLVSRLGFNAEAVTISKNYFEFSFEPRGDLEVNSLIKNYGIETYLGHWVPKVIFDKFATRASTKLSLKEFVENLVKAWKDQQSSIESKIEDDFRQMKEEGLLELPKRSPEAYKPFENLKQRIGVRINNKSSVNNPTGLINNDKKLRRIFLKMAEVDLPFDISNSKDISDIFDDINYTIESKKKMNRSMYAFHLAIKTVDISVVQKSDLIEKAKNSPFFNKTLFDS